MSQHPSARPGSERGGGGFPRIQNWSGGLSLGLVLISQQLQMWVPECSPWLLGLSSDGRCPVVLKGTVCDHYIVKVLLGENDC